MLDSFEEDHIKSVNESIQEGVPPPKSKRVDLLKRIAVSLHILTYTLSDLICDGSLELYRRILTW